MFAKNGQVYYFLLMSVTYCGLLDFIFYARELS